MSASDRQLAQRIAAGDRVAFEELLDRYGPRVHRLVRRYAACEANAEDLTQEIFLDVYRSAAGFRGDSTLATWIYRIALNHCLRQREKALSRTARESTEPTEEPADLAADPARHAARGELRSHVHNALEDLSPAQRDVVVLHELHGLTYGECARVLGVPVGTVKSRLSNASVRLRVSLGGYVLGDEDRIGKSEPLGEAV